jgi:acyl-CoA synthetase (AMP-forming)/AMP-acid ligase II
MPNTAEWPIVLLGAVEAGLIVSTSNPNYTAGRHTAVAITPGNTKVVRLEAVKAANMKEVVAWLVVLHGGTISPTFQRC